MAKEVYNVVRPREGGDGKTYWDKHGVVVIKDGRISLHLDSVPTGTWDGWFHVYPREEAQQHKDNSGAQVEPISDFEDVPY